MIVVDASTLIYYLTDDGPAGRRARLALNHDADWAAPSHLLVETVANIRKLMLGGKITVKRAEDAINACLRFVIDEVPAKLLIPRVWELRANVSGYDAFYVAAAEHYNATLVTADIRLTNAPGLRCRILVI